MAHQNDLTARRAAARYSLLIARFTAFAMILGTAVGADWLDNRTFDYTTLWIGMAALLVAYHALTRLVQRLLAGWERRAIRMMVNARDPKRQVVTRKAVQLIDLEGDQGPPTWLDELDHAPRRRQVTYS